MTDYSDEKQVSVKNNVDRKLDLWKNKLLDLGKRNRLLNYHDTKSSNLRIVVPEFNELWESFVLEEQPIVFPYYDEDSDGDEDDYCDEPKPSVKTNQSTKEQQKTLRNLRNKAKIVLEEQGVNVLYLAFGFLKWTEAEASHYPLQSPILLVPVTLSWESITSPFELSLSEDEIVVNPTLVYKLESDFGITLPAFDQDLPIEKYLLSISNLVKRNGWEVSTEVGLSLFSFLKINMYRDMDANHDIIANNAVVRALCGDASTIDRSSLNMLNEYDHDKQDLPISVFQVVDADSSQQDAIVCAKKGMSFILQGPPGTGKSQTITNIIAECLADGKKVLFVSEKMAALEVVKRRLEKAGLGDFCLTLHSYKTNKKDVMEQLRTTLDLAEKKAELSDEAYQRLDVLQADKNLLNEYSEQLFSLVTPLNKTIYAVNGIIANLDSYDDVVFLIPNIEEIDSEKYNTIIIALKRFVDTIGKMSDDYKQNPWYGAGVSIVTNELRHDISAKTASLLSKTEQLQTVADNIFAKYHILRPISYANLNNILTIFNMTIGSPIVPVDWVWNNNYDLQLDAITKCEKRQRQYFENKVAFHNSLTRIPLGDIHISETIVTEIDVNNTSEQIQRVISTSTLYFQWDKMPDTQLLYDVYTDFFNHVNLFREKRKQLLEVFDRAVFSFDHNAMLQRFKTDYQSFFKVFKGQYKKDKKTIIGLHKEVIKKLDDASIITLLNDLKVIDEQVEWVNANSERLNTTFSELFMSIDTDFDAISKQIGFYTELKKTQSILAEINDLVCSSDNDKSMLIQLFGDEYSGIETDWTSILKKVEWTEKLRQVLKSVDLNREFVDYICSTEEAKNSCSELSVQLKKQLDISSAELNWFVSLFTEPETIMKMSIPSLCEKMQGCRNGLANLEEWIDYRTARLNCATLGLNDYLRAIDEIHIDAEKIIPVFKKRFYRMWLDAILPKYPAVLNFRRKVQESRIAEFDSLDVLQFEIAKARVKQKLINELPSLNHFTNGVDEISILRRELAKQRKIMPLRKLFRAIPNLLPTLKPCLMMSPLSVSLFLDAGSYHFDTIIFDEASQVCTENAIGAISRGNQVIIAGDSKQLPPTSFFNTTTNDTDFDSNESDEEEYDDNAYESILDEATLLPERTLLWHYRSRHEHLIAFSNSQIYHNNLITFPSNIERAPDIGVEYYYVPNAVYDRGGRKGNVVEAHKVAELVFEHFLKYPNRSIGVIAFGEIQQQAIDSEIRKMRMDNQQFEPFFKEDSAEPFFVKNLENVQGDERDTIIFSIGYAKDSSGKMYMNFGPLSVTGGERRLNVAITRAKFNVKLVGSIHSTDINIEAIKSEGPKLLRNYIDFAINGPVALQTQISESESVVHDSPFEEAVFNFLERKGYKLSTQVGCSNYRIDMAVRHPTLSGRYVIGIECDGATYHSARTARERDRLRQSVLESMGWKIYRIWSTDWIKDPITEGQMLIEAIEDAIAQSTVESSDSLNVDITRSKTDDTTDFLAVDNKETSFEEEQNPYGFIEYKAASFDKMPRDSWGYVQVSDCLMEIVKVEYPVHYEILCQKLAGLFGNSKATIKVRREVDYAIKQLNGKLIRKGDFFYPIGYTTVPVRFPNYRKINYISVDEIKEAMNTIAKSCVGTTMEGLVSETTRAYGFSRAGANITVTMQSAFDALVSEGRLSVKDNKVVVNN